MDEYYSWRQKVQEEQRKSGLSEAGIRSNIEYCRRRWHNAVCSEMDLKKAQEFWDLQLKDKQLRDAAMRCAK